MEFLSHATIVGFMGGAATVVCLQQLKGILGLLHFTHEADVVSVMKSVFSQRHLVSEVIYCLVSHIRVCFYTRTRVNAMQWRWESGVLGCCFLFFLFLTRYFVSNAYAMYYK